MALRYELSIIHALIGLSLLLEDTAAVNEIWKCGAPKVGPLFFPELNIGTLKSKIKFSYYRVAIALHGT